MTKFLVAVSLAVAVLGGASTAALADMHHDTMHHTMRHHVMHCTWVHHHKHCR